MPDCIHRIAKSHIFCLLLLQTKIFESLVELKMENVGLCASVQYFKGQSLKPHTYTYDLRTMLAVRGAGGCLTTKNRL